MYLVASYPDSSVEEPGYEAMYLEPGASTGGHAELIDCGSQPCMKENLKVV